MINDIFHGYIIFNSYTVLISCMILLIGAVVIKYSINYLDGNKNKKSYLTNMSLLVLSTILLVNSNSLILFFLSFVGSNYLLTKIMLHNSNWEACLNSIKLAQKNFMLASILLLVGFVILYAVTDQLFITDIDTYTKSSRTIEIALFFIVLATFCQSALWPFNKWLLSSLNSPTPTSAIMHAGLVNGGGIILLKFYPLLLHSTGLLSMIFVFGLATAMLGTAYKLVQPCYKNILACSTSGQMGFMFVQFALGLFPAAITHLICHSFFKSFLFLNHGEQANNQNRKSESNYTNKGKVQGLIYGLCGSTIFHFLLFGLNFDLNTSLFITLGSFILCSHTAISVLNLKKNSAIALLAALFLAFMHAVLITSIEHLIYQDLKMHFFQINILHSIGLGVLFISWFFAEIHQNLSYKLSRKITNKIYVWALNGSMPNSSTITSTSNGYNYL